MASLPSVAAKGGAFEFLVKSVEEHLDTFKSQLEDFARNDKTGVQIVVICLQTRPHNGGLINLLELCNLLHQRRKSDREAVSEDDILRATSTGYWF